MKAAILLRVSTEEQAEQNLSIPAQKSRNLAYCEAKGWQVYDYYTDDGYSGKDLNRPEMQRLIADALGKKFDAVLVWKLDRLSRRQQHVMYLIEDVFLANGIEFASVTENIDTSTAMGRAMTGIMAVFAQLERETIIERTKMGKEEAAKQGRYYGGPPLFGYRNNPAAKKLEINPVEAAVVRFIYSEYLKGDRGYQSIAAELTRLGVPSPGEKPFWYVMTVRRILRNPVYAGYIRHRDTLYQGRHDPIIPELEFRQAQKLIECNRKRFRPLEMHEGLGLLRGVTYCAECGARLRFKSAGTRNGVQRLFYVCYSVDRRARHMIADDNCPSKYQNAVKLEKKVVDAILTYSPDPVRLRQEVREEARRKLEAQGPATSSRYIRAELEETRRRITKWQHAFEQDAITLEEFRDRLKELQTKRQQLEDQLENRQPIATVPVDHTPGEEELIEQLNDFRRLWTLADATDRRRLVLSFIKKVHVDRDGSTRIEWL
ncbi:MAG: recombinase family protein [Negativicutes bacterium]|nr:recombinase family protein [Negativicutes bacterium]